MKALFVIDMQNDFVTGSLAVSGALDLIQPIKDKILKAHEVGNFILYSKCWHPINHCSFNTNGGYWPVHCVQNSWGAEIYPRLRESLFYVSAWSVLKGQNYETEEYSAFTLYAKNLLEQENIGSIEICGLARDYCVKSTYEDLKKDGYYVKILENLCKSVNNG